MAGIDKTYVTQEQYKRFIKYFNRKIRRRMKRDLGYVIDIPKYNETTSFESEDDTRVLWNTSQLEDLWIAKNIKLDFIQDRLKGQYNESWVGFKVDLDFRGRGWILRIKTNGGMVQPYKTKIRGFGGFKVKPYYKLLSYGTTHLYKLLYDSLYLIGGSTPYDYENEITIDFDLFGSLFHLEYTEDDVKIIHVCYNKREGDLINQEVDWFYHDIVGEYTNPKSMRKEFLKFLPKYSIISNPSIRKMKWYQPEQIIFSEEDKSYDMGEYIDYNKKLKLRYYDSGVPRFIQTFKR